MKESLKKSLNKTQAGFTLLEMTIVLLILGLLMLVILPNIAAIRKDADNRQAKAMRSVVQTQVDLYLNEESDNDNKEEPKVSFETLKNAKYLTVEQIKRAEKVGIIIENNIAKRDV
ncbi:prepilin-type N-terminal cleavage/methylation domain-containing protein [Periweissella beninensis]|uniref:Prepilin-type N-terminal cleavage/methylation domain-containing protein n=1 Tax=Periweissella beninensis TaxID=504936 RepID=A0ABT0VNB4_9LACO|nr:prepilin-type N-terminal cleavage/methylation domain-containing protein [Periweissella beninensis]MBM7544527.1 competence protein ComGC [Periweissella beninensis]MCM2438025.1 prepilin-type N-terminal cleavage/methylation domain-containing protein [Periweissella beninensis]MCT4396942.1 prepilin-type N-terminal cleavage/methylation domain-containing protein [Periweissella beninensis]